MKKNYMTPQVEDVVLEPLMGDATFLGIASVSNGDPLTISGGTGA